MRHSRGHLLFRSSLPTSLVLAFLKGTLRLPVSAFLFISVDRGFRGEEIVFLCRIGYLLRAETGLGFLFFFISFLFAHRAVEEPEEPGREREREEPERTVRRRCCFEAPNFARM